MTEFNVTSDTSAVFSLTGDLTVKTVMQAWPERLDTLARAASGSAAPVLNLEGVAHVDTAGLAWLVQLVSQCLDKKIDVRLHNLPESLQKLAKISDVERLLPLQ